MLRRTLKLKESEGHLFQTHVRPTLEYFSLIYSDMRLRDRIAIKNLHRAFTKQLICCSVSLNYMERCQWLELDPLWLKGTGVNRTHFNNINTEVSCVSALRVRNTLFCSL